MKLESLANVVAYSNCKNVHNIESLRRASKRMVKCKWMRMIQDLSLYLSLSLSFSLTHTIFAITYNAYLSPSSYSHILPHNVRVLVVLHNLLICDKCLCLGCNNLVFFPQGSNIMILFQFHDILNNSYATYQLTFS